MHLFLQMTVLTIWCCMAPAAHAEAGSATTPSTTPGAKTASPKITHINPNSDTVLLYENGVFTEEKKRTDLPPIQQAFLVEKIDSQGKKTHERVLVGIIESLYIGEDGDCTTYEKALRTHVTVYSQDGEFSMHLVLGRKQE